MRRVFRPAAALKSAGKREPAALEHVARRYQHEIAKGEPAQALPIGRLASEAVMKLPTTYNFGRRLTALMSQRRIIMGPFDRIIDAVSGKGQQGFGRLFGGMNETPPWEAYSNR